MGVNPVMFRPSTPSTPMIMIADRSNARTRRPMESADWARLNAKPTRSAIMRTMKYTPNAPGAVTLDQNARQPVTPISTMLMASPYAPKGPVVRDDGPRGRRGT